MHGSSTASQCQQCPVQQPGTAALQLHADQEHAGHVHKSPCSSNQRPQYSKCKHVVKVNTNCVGTVPRHMCTASASGGEARAQMRSKHKMHAGCKDNTLRCMQRGRPTRHTRAQQHQHVSPTTALEQPRTHLNKHMPSNPKLLLPHCLGAVLNQAFQELQCLADSACQQPRVLRSTPESQPS